MFNIHTNHELCGAPLNGLKVPALGAADVQHPAWRQRHDRANGDCERARCSFLDRNLHSRSAIEFHAFALARSSCMRAIQWHASRASTFLPLPLSTALNELKARLLLLQVRLSSRPGRVRCAFLGRNLHSRMPLIPSPTRLKLLHACDQWHSSATHSSYRLAR
jgi:hypothetical protein